jgi:arylsulfatase A-like enzyme
VGWAYPRPAARCRSCSAPPATPQHYSANGIWGYLPEFSPLKHGFDSFFGFKSGYIDYYQHTDSTGKPDLFENDTPTPASGYMTDLITQRSVTFIAEHAKSPFFLEVAYNAAHWPYQVPDHPSQAIDNSRHLLPQDENTATRADYVKIMGARRPGRRANHGRARSPGAGRQHDRHLHQRQRRRMAVLATRRCFNRKFTLYEGGIRVPAVVRWPGHVPAGVVSAQVGITMDLSASILAAAGAAVPPDAMLEGINLWPLLATNAKPVSRTLFWRVTTAGLNQRAVRDGDWKLLLEGSARVMLFDLSADLGERNDVSAANTAVVRRLHQQLLAWEKDVDAEAKSRQP